MQRDSQTGVKQGPVPIRLPFGSHLYLLYCSFLNLFKMTMKHILARCLHDGRCMTSQFSPKVSEILAYSREEAARLASRSVGPEHLLLGIMRIKDGPVNNVFRRLDIDLASVKTALESRVREDEIGMPINTNELVLNEKASNILKLAVLEARIQRTTRVEEQHLLLAILHDQVENGAKVVLEMNNMNYEDTLTLLSVKNGIGMPDEDYEEEEESAAGSQHQSSAGNQQTTTQTKQQKKSKTPVLDNFSTDLTQQWRYWADERRTTPY